MVRINAFTYQHMDTLSNQLKLVHMDAFTHQRVDSLSIYSNPFKLVRMDAFTYREKDTSIYLLHVISSRHFFTLNMSLSCHTLTHFPIANL